MAMSMKHFIRLIDPVRDIFLKDELAKSPVLADMADGVNLANAVGVCHMRQQLIGEAKARMTFPLIQHEGTLSPLKVFLLFITKHLCLRGALAN